MRFMRFAAPFVLGLSTLVAGDIQFEIRDFSIPFAPKLVASAVKKQTVKDVRVIRVPGIAQTTSLIQLVDGFALKISTPDENPLNGFGLSGWSDTGLFSWEWFDRDKGTTFLKLQEGGSLKVDTKITKGVMVITSIELLSDISIRLEESGSDKISFRILLKKGSVISLIS